MPSQTNNDSKIPLAQMISDLRLELERAQADGRNQGIRFHAERIELELKVAVTSSAKGEGGIKFWVVNAGGSLENSDTTTHTFKLTLIPVDSRTGSRVEVVAAETKPPSHD